jgi:hypothetical protein
MTAPAAIRAVFSEWRMVKTRKVLALIFEVPLEQQAEVLTMLGAPMPDAEIWCAIARLATGAEKDAAQTQSNKAQAAMDASQRGKERYKESTPMQQALIRAARLPADERFRAWVAAEYGTSIVEEDTAVRYIQERCCAGESRRLIAEDPPCYQRYIAMETRFRIDVGEMAEPR